MVTTRKPRGGGATVTSRDVARALNISQSTVSRAFTPGASISPALRKQIVEAAEKIGYRPNLLARGLIAGRSNLIGFVLQRETNLLYPALLYELSGRLAERGYQVLLFPIGDKASVRDSIDRIWAYRVDAILATGVLREEEAALFDEHGLPLVMFNRVFDLPVSSVSCDFAAGARDLTTRLLKAGHKRIGLVSGPQGSFVGAEVERGMKAALKGADVELRVTHFDYRYECGAEAIDALHAGGAALPSALFCVNDTVAAGCLDHLRDVLHLSVPKDLSIVTFGGFGPARWKSYDFTGMQQPMAQMTAAAVDLLLGPLDESARGVERRAFLPTFMEGHTAAL